MAEQEETPTVPDLSIEFVSKLVGRKVVSFTISPATAPGDNYNSIMYNIKCVLEGHEVLYGISKCFPSHPMRQGFLIKSNMFWSELCMYKELIPTLKAFEENLGVYMKLPFAPLISGEAIDYGKGKINEENIAKYSGTVFGPFDNYLMMVDLKNTYGFRMADRMVGLNLEKVSLIMTQHSKLHALSWAYKVKNGIQNLSEKMPYLSFELKTEDAEMWSNIISGSAQSAHDTLKTIPGINPGILDGILKVKENVAEIIHAMFVDKAGPHIALEKFLRVKPDYNEAIKKADEVPWKVVIHGDCWINNLLFRYDEVTHKAVELLLIDLQVMQESCPTMDLTYMIYTSTTAEFRRKHLEDMLKLYYSSFKSYCDKLGVGYLPGFSLEALKRRFHTSKYMGLTMALMALPAMLKDSKDMQDVDKIKDMSDMSDMMEAITQGSGENALFKERILGVCQDLYNDGLL